jgi:CelD/BcsL family acetyltransferase involved in cellulose biosynthesis
MLPDRIDVISPQELTADHLQKWQGFQNRFDDFANPFFSPNFTQLIGRHRQDVRVAVAEAENETIGFFPFHRKPGGRGVPIGGHICDYQGCIGPLDDPTAADGLLRASGLSSYNFNHALASRRLFVENAFWHSSSPFADVSLGFDAWKAEINKKTDALKTVERKKRKLAREIGPLRFVVHDTSPEAWQDFAEWKGTSLGGTGGESFPGKPWVADVFAEIMTTQTEDFGGYLSTLYAGDRRVAAHFGLRSRKVWHWWFPTYDQDVRAYSPGLILLVFCVEEAARLGLSELDFGRGSERYKKEFGNRSHLLCEGSLERRTTLAGNVSLLRKSAQRLANRNLSKEHADFMRRAANHLLHTGIL